MEVLKNTAVKTRLPWLRQCCRTNFRKIAKFGGHNLNGFEVI